MTGTKIALPPEKYQSLDEMQKWFEKNIKPVCSGVAGQMLRWEAGFAEAKESNIKVMSLSFTRLDVKNVGDMTIFMRILKEYHEKYCPDTLFIPTLTYGRGCNVDEEVSKMDELLSYHFFKAIDTCDDGRTQPVENFKSLYRKAKEHKLRLMSHVGEFNSADDVMRAVEVLELQEVQHGIAAADSREAMELLAKNKIQLNICPSSNVMLHTAKSYAEHPIQKLYRYGIPVTINTDDLLIFNQTVGEEYLNLYRAGTLTAKELDEIRRRGLNCW